jgi:hypothetical protein
MVPTQSTASRFLVSLRQAPDTPEPMWNELPVSSPGVSGVPVLGIGLTPHICLTSSGHLTPSGLTPYTASYKLASEPYAWPAWLSTDTCH